MPIFLYGRADFFDKRLKIPLLATGRPGCRGASPTR